MKKRATILGMLILSIAAVVLSTATTHAAPPGDDLIQIEALIQTVQAAENPGEAFNNLSPQDQEAAIEYLSGGSTEVVTEVTMIGVDGAYTASSANESCARQTKTTTHRSYLGTTLWKYISRTLWCWNGTEITNDPWWERDVWTADLWVFYGHVDSNESGGQGDWVHRDYTQGHFALCLGGDLGCVTHMYPSLSKAQYGNGSSS